MAEDLLDFVVVHPDLWELFRESDESIEGVFDYCHIVVLQKLVEKVKTITKTFLYLVQVQVVGQAAEHQH